MPGLPGAPGLPARPPAAPPSPVAAAPSPARGSSDPEALLGVLLQALTHHAGSDLHLKAGSAPRIRVDGRLTPLNMPPVGSDDCDHLIRHTMGPAQTHAWDSGGESDYALEVPEAGRFRAHAYRVRGLPALVLRRVLDGTMDLTSLGLPPVVQQLALEPHGLVLIAGPTGAGKTTTLAAMVELINTSRSCHIVTIEDPIEIVHTDKMASVSQREVHIDTRDVNTALRAVLREDPDVIVIGEIRDEPTMRAALHAAESGHLVLTTLHTSDASETVHRVIDFFPTHEHRQVRMSLANSLRGIISQRLLPRVGGVGRVVATEVTVGTARVSEAIADMDSMGDLLQIISEGDYYGMQTFQQDLHRLITAGLVSIHEARAAATDPHDFDVFLRRNGVNPDAH